MPGGILEGLVAKVKGNGTYDKFRRFIKNFLQEWSDINAVQR